MRWIAEQSRKNRFAKKAGSSGYEYAGHGRCAARMGLSHPSFPFGQGCLPVVAGHVDWHYETAEP